MPTRGGDGTAFSFLSLSVFFSENTDRPLVSRNQGFWHTSSAKAEHAFCQCCREARQNGTRITPDLLAGIPRGRNESGTAFLWISSDERSRGAAKQDATWSHPIPTAALAMSGRRFQI